MKILIDTNVILDVLCNRQPFVTESAKIFKYCETKKITGYISALSIPNIVYILRKELTPETTQEIINRLTLIFNIADLKIDDIIEAGKLQMPDFEDALQSVCASRIKADYIITRNITDFQGSKTPAIKPSELADRL